MLLLEERVCLSSDLLGSSDWWAGWPDSMVFYGYGLTDVVVWIEDHTIVRRTHEILQPLEQISVTIVKPEQKHVSIMTGDWLLEQGSFGRLHNTWNNPLGGDPAAFVIGPDTNIPAVARANVAAHETLHVFGVLYHTMDLEDLMHYNALGTRINQKEIDIVTSNIGTL